VKSIGNGGGTCWLTALRGRGVEEKTCWWDTNKDVGWFGNAVGFDFGLIIVGLAAEVVGEEHQQRRGWFGNAVGFDFVLMIMGLAAEVVGEEHQQRRGFQILFR